ncbi:CASP-like protein 3A1 isoform X1 [Phoenix dactylifera]|uniref:CASP-like protein n=1 Tax=Phoenix dactylifera TaxID=42345 RepID=A0A8B7CRB1_PHODC|nr:CASP-like protein 3A1 isoform X1 [Phoenix dactylifera]
MDGAGKGRKALAEVGIQMPEAAKVAVAVDSGTMSGPLVPVTGRPDGAAAAGRRWDIAGAAMRAATVVSSLLALALMVSAEQRGELSLFGFQLPLHSKWSFSDSLEYLVGISAAVAAHSLLQLLLSVRKLVKKAPVIPSRRHGWVIFAGDQAFAYAMMSAGSAAAGITNLNRTGIRHTALPDFCKPLHRFCDRMAISITFAFLSCLLLATSAILDVLWLSKY